MNVVTDHLTTSIRYHLRIRLLEPKSQRSHREKVYARAEHEFYILEQFTAESRPKP